MITAQQLVSCGVGPMQAGLFAAPLSATIIAYGIATPEQIAAFLAQTMWETTKFTQLAESTYYSKPELLFNTFQRLRPLGMTKLAAYCRNSVKAANLIYANLNGNGDEASGDGFAYRGSGLLQLTGRANFKAAADALGVDFVSTPDLVRSMPEYACATAGWFWQANKCNDALAAGGFDGTTLKVQGVHSISAANGAIGRRTLFATALPVFTTQP